MTLGGSFVGSKTNGYANPSKKVRTWNGHRFEYEWYIGREAWHPPGLVPKNLSDLLLGDILPCSHSWMKI
jgi:hypothetical protein